MSDTTISVGFKADGATQAAAETRQFAGAIQDLEAKEKTIALAQLRAKEATALRSAEAVKLQARLEALTRAEEKARAATAANGGGHGGGGSGGGGGLHGGLGSLMPRGFEATGGRIAGALGMGNIGAGAAAILGPVAAALPVIYAAAEVVSAVTERIAEHERSLAEARQKGLETARHLSQEQSAGGAANFRSNEASLRLLQGLGGDRAVKAADLLTSETGDATSTAAMATIFDRFKTESDRARAKGIVTRGVQAGLGSAADVASKLTPWTMANNLRDDQILGQLYTSGGVPRSEAEIQAMVERYGQGRTGGTLAKVDMLRAKRLAVEGGRRDAIAGEEGEATAKAIDPYSLEVSKLTQEYQRKDDLLAAEQSHIRYSPFRLMISRLSGGTLMPTKGDERAQLKREFDAQVDALNQGGSPGSLADALEAAAQAARQFGQARRQPTVSP